MRELLRRLFETGGAVTADDLAALDRGARERAAELDRAFDAIRHANEPTVLPDERTALLKDLLSRTWRDRRGQTATLLLPDEFRFLAIPQGSLSPEERISIEGHVAQTWRFLSSIPWTADLARVPEIAYGHHEKLDGTGYPQRLGSSRIPVATRALTICDIYDALTASDRPYKKAVALDAALGILAAEAREGRIDRWLVDAFISEKVWAAVGP
jgi:3',5'-cyclic-nucleotide phosphodiesterase